MTPSQKRSLRIAWYGLTFVVLCSGCRTTPDEFKKVLLRRTYTFKPSTSKESST
jgi:hypothetical protein